MWEVVEEISKILLVAPDDINQDHKDVVHSICKARTFSLSPHYIESNRQHCEYGSRLSLPIETNSNSMDPTQAGPIPNGNLPPFGPLGIDNRNTYRNTFHEGSWLEPIMAAEDYNRPGRMPSTINGSHDTMSLRSRKQAAVAGISVQKLGQSAPVVDLEDNRKRPRQQKDRPNESNHYEVVERILANAEHRQEDNNSGQGPLSPSELSNLSVLCSMQTSRKQGIADDLGFADVDPDMIGQLVELLEKHVTMASNLDVFRDAFHFLKSRKSTADGVSIDQVRTPINLICSSYSFHTSNSASCILPVASK